jgi:hypothetical protein
MDVLYIWYIPHNQQTTLRVRTRNMLFNATFNSISAISWWSVLLVEETDIPGENHRHVTADILKEGAVTHKG